MPETVIHVFRDEDGSVPFREWMHKIETQNRKVYNKCRIYIRRLRERGHELRRPTADLLRDGVYELRINSHGVNYRILYGFVGKHAVLISHGITKEKKVPPAEIDKAVNRLAKYKTDPEKYGVIDDG